VASTARFTRIVRDAPNAASMLSVVCGCVPIARSFFAPAFVRRGIGSLSEDLIVVSSSLSALRNQRLLSQSTFHRRRSAIPRRGHRRSRPRGTPFAGGVVADRMMKSRGGACCAAELAPTLRRKPSDGRFCASRIECQRNAPDLSGLPALKPRDFTYPSVQERLRPNAGALVCPCIRKGLEKVC